jgi:hypothetical protein
MRREVDQGRFVERQVQALPRPSFSQGQRRLGQGDPAGVGLLVEVLVALLAQALVPPGVIGSDRLELGALVGDRDRLAGRGSRVGVAEAQAVIEQPEGDVETLVQRRVAGQRDASVRMVVADDPLLAPGLLPRRVEAARWRR